MVILDKRFKSRGCGSLDVGSTPAGHNDIRQSNEPARQ